MRRAPAVATGLLVAAALLAGAACSENNRKAFTPLPDTVPPASTVPDSVAPPVACAAEAAAPTTAVYADITGVDPNLLSLDVYPLPADCGPRPVLFWLHGGNFEEGDKSKGMAEKAAMAARYGWVLVSINHRLVGDVSPVWPYAVGDVASAITYTLDHATEFGIDTEHVGIMGFNTGGQLAAVLTIDSSHLVRTGAPADAIDCLVTLDAETYDLLAKIDTGAEADILAVEKVFGEDFQGLQQASPEFLLTQHTGRMADTFVVTRGDLDRQALANDFADLVRATSANVTVVAADRYSADDVKSAVGDPKDTVINPPLVQFLSTCLG